MRRVKLLKDCKQGKAQEIVVLDNNEAHGLIDSGLAEITKDMTETDYKVLKPDEEQAGEVDGVVTIV